LSRARRGKIRAEPSHERRKALVVAIVALILIVALFSLGFAVKALLWVALALLVLWAIGWFMGLASSSGDGRRRWYYW
jgi:hypothetical protein